MAAEHDVAVSAPSPAVAAQAVSEGSAPLGADAVLSLQRTAGNQAVCRAIASGQIARAPASVGVAGVTVSPAKVSVPVEAGVSVKATASPANATGVTWALKDGTAAVSGSTIDAKGAIALGASQPGGTLEAEATADDSSSFALPFHVVGKPTGIASTAAASSGTYSGTFTHTLTEGAALEGGNINEKFDSQSATTDFGKFTLKANAAGSHGWDLDASGTMAGPDNVSIDQSMIDANAFVANASNPTPAKSLPAGFTMQQHLFAKSFPSGKLDAAAFADTDHVRNLEDRGGALKVVLKAGKGEVAIDYAGPAVYRGAKADKTSVEASAAKPAAGDWKRNEVQVSVTVLPSGSAVKYSLAGDALGCEVDSSGKVLTGDKAGTIKVRAGDGDKHYDEVSITITPRPVPAATPKAAGAEGGEAAPAGEAPDGP